MTTTTSIAGSLIGTFGIILVDQEIEDSGSAINEFSTMQDAEEAARYANRNRSYLYGEGGEFLGVRGEWIAYKV